MIESTIDSKIKASLMYDYFSSIYSRDVIEKYIEK